MSRCLRLGLSLVALSGCQTTHQQAKQEATQRWNRLRAEVKAKLAADQLAAGYVSDATGALTEAYALDPTLPELTVLWARTLLAEGQIAEAERVLSGASVAGQRDADVDYLLGIIAQQRRRWDDALEHFRGAAEKDPHEVAYLVAVSESLLQAGKPKEALDHLAGCEYEFGWTPAYGAAQAEVYEQLGRWNDAAVCWRQVVDGTKNNSDILDRLAMALYRAGRTTDATPVLMRMLRDAPDDVSETLRLSLAHCLVEDEQLSAAHDQVNVVLRKNPSHLRALHLLTRIFAEQNEYDRALRTARRTLRIDPDHPLSLELAAALATRVGEDDDARALAARLLELRPENPVAQTILAGTNVSGGE